MMVGNSKTGKWPKLIGFINISQSSTLFLPHELLSEADILLSSVLFCYVLFQSVLFCFDFNSNNNINLKRSALIVYIHFLLLWTFGEACH